MSGSVAVLGGGVGGLSAAIYARLAGHDVVLLEAGRLGGKAAGLESMGYRLDPGPSIIILIEIYEALFRSAGRSMADYLRFQRLDPISRVYFEDAHGPIDLPAGVAKCRDVVKEVAPEDAEAFARLMDRLSKVAPLIERSIFRYPIDRPWQLLNPALIRAATSFDSRLTFKEFVDREFKSDLLRAFFYGFPSYSGQSYNSKAFGSLLIPYFMLERGVHYPEPGVSAIPAALERLARELGVEIRTGYRVERLLRNGRMIAGVVDSGGEVVEAQAYISNIDRLATKRMMGQHTKVAPSLSYFTVSWGIWKKLEGLLHHTLLIPAPYKVSFEQLYIGRQVPEAPIVYCNATSETVGGTAPPGCTNLFAVVSTPALEDHIHWDDEACRLKNAIRKSLARIGCSWRDDEVDFERVQTPAYFESAHGNYRGSLYGPDEPFRLFNGMFPLSCRDDKILNLFYCGGSVQPGAGLPMVTLSGRFAAAHADRYLRSHTGRKAIVES